MTNKRPTQCQRIIHYMETFGSISQYEAFADLGVLRLASRISEMKKKGIEIEGKQEAVRNRFGEKCYVTRYYLKKERNDERV